MNLTNQQIVIIGAGMAGLTLARQLKMKDPNLSITVIDKRKNPAPNAIHKVGESTVELGAIYLRHKLQLADYLDQHQLAKHGIRFFHHSSSKDKIENRIELGSKAELQFKTNHIDRGIFENDLVEILLKEDVTFHFNTAVQEINWGKESHEVIFKNEDITSTISARWIVDCSGRFGFLKKKLSLEKPSNYIANAAWFRINEIIDVSNWSTNKDWQRNVIPEVRKLSTIHLMGKGYWVWIIPLVSKATSIGIVADPKYHDPKDFNTFEKANTWLKQHEIQLAKKIEGIQPLDFKIINHYAHNIKKHFSADRWATSGEAGAFVDPLYSPGADFIGMANDWITKLISMDSLGQDITESTKVFNNLYQSLITGWTTLYQNQYHIYEKPQVFQFKILWDWGSYWAIACLLFKNNALTDINSLNAFIRNEDNSMFNRYGQLISKMQALFSAWALEDQNEYESKTYSVFENSQLLKFQVDLLNNYTIEETMIKINDNMHQLELLAGELYRIYLSRKLKKPISLDIDPYITNINDSLETLIINSKSTRALSQDKTWKKELSKHIFAVSP